MNKKLNAWLSLFRIVNLPTVPGDILVGAAISVLSGGASKVMFNWYLLVASIGSIFIYLYGIVDNDIVGAKRDLNRPIPNGEVSLLAARIMRAIFVFLALILGIFVGAGFKWIIVAFPLIVFCALYNRTKLSFLMGLCRGYNVFMGFFYLTANAIILESTFLYYAIFALPVLWTIYIAIVTKLAKSEDENPSRRQLIAQLIGALVYFQLLSLVIMYLIKPVEETRLLLLIGTGCLILLRLVCKALPRVSAT